MKKKILIIGGTGFIGSSLIRFLKKKEFFTIVSISSKKITKNFKVSKVKYIVCDISKKNEIEKKLKNLEFDYVINLAGYVDHKHKIKTYNSHFLGLRNISNHFLKKKIKKFVQIGSSLEYGKSKTPHKENIFVNKKTLKSTYSYSKYLATEHLLKIYKQNKFPVTIFRLYLVYGPGQATNRIIPIVINNCLKNLSFETSSGKQIRDFIYIDDLIRIIYKSLRIKKSSGHVYNIGSGKPIQIKKLIKMIKNKIGTGNPLFGKIPLRKDEQIKIYPSINKIKKHFNFTIKYSIKKGLEKTIKYYKNSAR